MCTPSRRDFLKTAPAASLLRPEPSAKTGSLELTAPIDRWDEAIPLGNGLMGGLLWGAGSTLRLSLDRGDLWDLRTPETFLQKDWTYATLKRLVAEKDQDTIVRMYDKPYQEPYPTKVPAGRVEVTIGGEHTLQSFRLDLHAAVAKAGFSNGEAECFFSAAAPVAMLRVPASAVQIKLIAPESVKKLGYAPAREVRGTEIQWYLQTAAMGFQYGVVVGSRKNGDTTEIAVSVTSTKDAPDPVAEGRRRVRKALAAGYAALLEPHLAWWKQFWARSSVQLPDPALQLHYDEVQYFYGAASRRGAPPIPLQGVWTADEGPLPPWHGDYHHDLNTQLTYWAYLASGHFEEGEAFLEFQWELLEEHRRFAKDFYGAAGAAVPGVMTLDGKPMGGWSQYALSPATGAWVAHAFYLHWRHTMDRKFLAERAYPYCQAIGEFLHSLLRPGADGKLKLPLSSSPEMHNNSLKAWLTPNSNFDLALLRWLFGALAEMAPEAGHTAQASRWKTALERLDAFAVEGSDGALRVAPDESLTESHRHHSHLMAIHPLGLLHVEGTDRDRHIIRASLDQLRQFGTQEWCGYSFSWAACLSARSGDAESALRDLRIYLEAFISRNGFHLNGDYKGLGYAKRRYRPFTLEGNFAAAQAVHEMLLQSWGGAVRIFPAVPKEWSDVSIRNLRAEGAFLISARRAGGRTTQVSVTAAQGGTLRLRDPFEGRKVSWNRPAVTREGADYICRLSRGETLDGHMLD